MAENRPPPPPSGFSFHVPRQILFGEGKAALLAEITSNCGQRPAIITGASVDRHTALIAKIGSPLVVRQAGEPTVADLERSTSKARAYEADVIIGLGGGSALDLAKATAAMLANPGTPLDYLEVVGRGHPLDEPALPVIAVPTTSGTGSEVTRNAVLASPEHRVKVSMRHPSMVPEIALIDPELTYGLPSRITASTGLDALTQLAEAFVCRMANPLTDALCRSAIPRAIAALLALQRKPDDHSARRDMSYASLCGGLALANAGLGAVHGIAGPLGGMIPIPHGVACALLLPAVFSVNRDLAATLPGNDRIRLRFDELSQMFAPSSDPLSLLRELQAGLEAAGLAQFGLAEKQLPELVEKAARASSMRGNPFPLDRDQIGEILRRSL